MKSRTIQYIFLFLGVFALSTSAIFVKLANAPSSITAFYRLFFAAIVLLPFLIFNKDNRQALLSLSKKQLGLGILSGLFLAIHYVLWFESLNYTSVASSTVIVTLQPVFSFVFGHFLFKERISKKAIASCFVSLIGCFIIGWGDFEVSYRALFGDVLAFIAAGVITAYFITGQHMRKNLSVIPYSILGYSSSACFLAIYALSQHASFTNYSINTWKSFVGIALIATILGQMVFNWLLKWLNASVISMSILGETVGTCILAYFILDEVISLQQCVGILIILTGLASFLIQQNKLNQQTTLENKDRAEL
jgi:drug/metabolite transporter (DMT)-like permease